MSASTQDKLVRMANDIARNFEARGDAVAIEETAAHIRKFWDPRMRDMMKAQLEDSRADLSPIALAALRQLFDAPAP